MKLIVGLGNPGSRYNGTRHNIGFEVLAELARKLGSTRPRAKFEGEIIEGQLGGEKIALLCPLTYMNLSGRSVKAAVSFYQIATEDLLIVCDDFSLDLGRLRIRKSGSSGGQNGLADVIEKFGTRDICRLRVGIGKPPPRWDAANFVLSKFNKEDSDAVKQTIVSSAEAAICWAEKGVETAMNRFNAGPENQKTKRPSNVEADSKKKPDSAKTSLENEDHDQIDRQN